MLLWHFCTLGFSCRRCSRYQIAAVAACRHCCVPLPLLPLPLLPWRARLLSLYPWLTAPTSSATHLPALRSLRASSVLASMPSSCGASQKMRRSGPQSHRFAPLAAVAPCWRPAGLGWLLTVLVPQHCLAG